MPVPLTTRRELSLFDSTCIIVGVIIGAGIFETAPAVASSMHSAAGVLGIWLVGGIMALAGALCYAELASALPHQGGDYVYLGRAYGRWAGFLFGWCQLAVVRPGDIALLAFVFGRYAQMLWALDEGGARLYAFAAIVVLTAVNVAGVVAGKWTQNVLSVVKVLGLAGVAAVCLAAPGAASAPQEEAAFGPGQLELALILVLFAYGGWNEIAYVAAEVKRPQRNVVGALAIGVGAVAVLYLLVNAGFLHALGVTGMAASEAVAVDAVSAVLPQAAARVAGALICVSALGAVSALIFTGARISYALGSGHRAFRPLGRWHPEARAPVRALLVQGGLSALIVLVLGSFIDTILFTAPLVWIFFLATACSLFVLRRRAPGIDRPYRVTGYPVTVIVYCASCAFLLYGALSYAVSERPLGVLLSGGVVAVGAVVYWATEVRPRRQGVSR